MQETAGAICTGQPSFSNLTTNLGDPESGISRRESCRNMALLRADEEEFAIPGHIGIASGLPQAFFHLRPLGSAQGFTPGDVFIHLLHRAHGHEENESRRW